MASHKLIEFYFGSSTIVVNHIHSGGKISSSLGLPSFFQTEEDQFEFKITLNQQTYEGNFGTQIFSKKFTSKTTTTDTSKQTIDSTHSFSIDQNSTRVIFSFFRDNTKQAEIGVKFDTKRLTLVQNIHNTSGTSTRDEETVVFQYTGSDQFYTVPPNIKSVTVECWGAGGASQGSTTTANPYYASGSAGGGGYTKAILEDITGTNLKIIVGGGGLFGSSGAPAAATYGGGGSQVGGDVNWGTASGGGRSAVQIFSSGYYNDVVTAGGGGGAGVVQNFSTYPGYCAGGAGGSNNIGPIRLNKFGKGGDAENDNVTSQHGGTGGTQVAGGTNGVGTTTSYINAGKYTGGGGTTYGAGGGGGWYGGGYGGPVQNSLTTSTTTPLQTENLVLWLDASDPNTVTTASNSQGQPSTKVPINGGKVTAWKDKSKSGLTAIPFVATNVGGAYTTYNKTSLNGLPGINMNATSMYVPIPEGTFVSGFTFFVVFSSVGDQSYDTLINRTENDSGNPGPWEVHNNYIYIGNSSNNSFANTNTTPLFTLASEIDPSIYCLQASGSTPVNCWLNNDLFTNNQLEINYEDTGSNVYIGSRGDKGTSFNGVMSEIMIFNTILSLSQVQNVQKYLSNKWSVNMSGAGETSVLGSGSSWLLGGGGGGSSYVDISVAKALVMEQANGYIVAEGDKLPSAIQGTIGNGAQATNARSVGATGQPGYVRLTLKR